MNLGELLGPDLLEILHESPEAVREVLSSMHAADVAEVISALPREDRLRVLEQLDPPHLANTLTYADGETVKTALNRMRTEVLAAGLDALEADDAARLLSAIPEEKRAPILQRMSASDARAAGELLRYEPSTAGRLMTSKYVRIRPEQNVQEVLDGLRTIDPEVATVANLYVVDRNGVLHGVVSLRRLLPAAPRTAIQSLMTREIVSARADTPQDEVARLVSKYSFNALPIVDAQNHILGIVTVDDVVDVLVAGETEAMLRMGGVAAAEDESGSMTYFGTSIFRVVRMRFGWLLLLFVAGTLTGNVLRHFEGEMAKVIALSFFIPLIIGTGGNAGSQTVSTIIRALALGQVRLRDARRVLLREMTAGLLLGTLLCIFAIVRALLWKSGPELSLVVGLTILSVCLWANIIAALVPMLAQKFKIDPTVVSAPMITTLVDATGLAIYLLIAKAVLDL
ncbi:MAG TPA: magnesium transporter [Thermoanaerobaculia bacterium]|jgi:magnesium transporter|nr:magnesium transporter [Thermoanaerobaculia bacterium]